MKHLIKSPFPLAGKTASAVRLGIEKMEENWYTPNFRNSVHQQKKASNKSLKFVINQKSVSISQNEGFLEKYDFTGPKCYFHSNQYLKKKKMVSSSRNQIFKKFRPSSNCNNVFKKK